MIYDSHGNKVETKALTQELAGPSMTGMRQAWYDSVASGLTPEYLAAVLLAVDQGDITNYLTLAEEMEERDLHYRSVLSTRKLAVSGLNLVVAAQSDDPKDIERTDFVKEVCQGEAMTTLIADQLDALGKGFSVSEIMWDRTGDRWEPAEFKHRDARFFQFDRETGDVLRLRDAADMVNGIPLAPFKFVTHRPHLKTGLTIRGGLARLASVAFMCKGYSLRDWLAFAEVFGMPLRVGKYGLGASVAQKAELLRAVSSIGTDAACIIPDGMLIEFIENKSSGGDAIFQGLAEYLDKQVSKGVLGQTASTEGTPGKLGGDDSQENVRDDIRDSDAKQLATTIRRDVIRPLIDLNFGSRPVREYPSARLEIETPEDLEKLSRSLPPFLDRGLPVEITTILDKFGLPTPEPGAKLLKGQSAAPSPFGFPPGAGRPGVPGSPPVPGEPDEPAAEEEPPEEEAAPAEEDQEKDTELQREKRAAVLEIMQKVRRGQTLTADERQLLTLAYMERATKTPRQDEIDRLADEALGDWRKMMDPILAPVLEHARASGSYGEFLKGLEGVMAKMDSGELAKRLAVKTFTARGLGDGRDEP